jgi:hypothetical protein
MALYYESPIRAKPRPLIGVRDLRANLKAIIERGEPRIVGTHWSARCIILPIPKPEQTKRYHETVRLEETRKLFEEIMAVLER